MDMISDSGAVTDISEIAATLGIPAQDAEEINAMSLEQLCDEFNKFVVNEALSDEDVTILTPALESLRNVYHSVRDSGTISRSDASVLMKMSASLEGFQDPFATLPLASYTELPSKVNYNPSMENLLTAILRKIWEAIKAVAAKIKGFFSNNAVAETRQAAMENKVEQELTKRAAKIAAKKMEMNAEETKAAWREVDQFFEAAITDNRLLEAVYVYEPFLNSALQSLDGALDALFDANRKVAAMFGIEWSPLDPSLDQWSVASRQMQDILKHFTNMRNQKVQLDNEAIPRVLKSINSSAQNVRRYNVMRIFSLWKKVWTQFSTEQADYRKKWREAEEAGDEDGANELLAYLMDRYGLASALNSFNSIRVMMAQIKLDMVRTLDSAEQVVDKLSA